jgi:hypothetical protein
MFMRLSVGSGWILALFLSSAAIADEGPFGNLDFSRLSKPQEEFFWRRLRSLAEEEAVLTYCGQPDDFAQQAKRGIRACVTSEALDKAESFFRSELKATQDDLRARKASCRTKPEATQGWLGVEIQPIAKGDGDFSGGVGTGALVTGVVENSPAAAAGLKADDIITTVNGEAVASPKELSAKIRALTPAAAVQLGFSRDGARRTVSVKLGAMAFDQNGRAALDMPALVESSKQDLKYVADEVTNMCQRCKTTIWAMFCH